MQKWGGIELPTLGVALASLGGFAALTWTFHAWPGWAVVPAGGLLVAWYGSLQHECVHGHPTPWRGVNTALGSIPLSLWLPFEIYRESHLQHHSAPITDPARDPESFYVSADSWRCFGHCRRAVLWAHQTLLGRMLIGPPLVLLRLGCQELERLRDRDFSHAGIWLRHAVLVSLVLYWVIAICGIATWEYLLFFVYPSIAITLVRSFAEHLPVEHPRERTAIVEGSWLSGLLFLNNNLHVIHHDEPGLPWYEIPARYRARRESLRNDLGAAWMPSYSAVARNWGLRPKDSPRHPAL